MSKTRKLNEEGLGIFSRWLENPTNSTLPAELFSSETLTEPFGDYDIDPTHQFTSRMELGTYLNEQFSSADFNGLISPDSDGLWAWLAVVYFGQLTGKGVRRAEHYVVMRKGSAGSLAYRHAVRTPYELVHIHGEAALICLKSPMHTYGDMAEQLASRQTIAHNCGFFRAALDLYMRDGALRKGASSKPKKPKDRKPGDKTGLGSVRRLAIALQRLDLTYDTEDMDAGLMKAVLPKEFLRWSATA